MKTLEQLKNEYDLLETKIMIYNDQFGPNDDHVLKLKNMLKNVDAMILELMVNDQEQRLNKAVIA